MKNIKCKESIPLGSVETVPLSLVVVKTMRRKFRVSGLTPGQQYKVSMTAWTDAGQSPQGQFRLFTNKSRSRFPDGKLAFFQF